VCEVDCTQAPDGVGLGYCALCGRCGAQRLVGRSPLAYCDRRANLDVTDIKKQVQFWQNQGRLDKRVAAVALLDLSFIGEETIAPQSWRR
jgi:hypothetical protein